MGNMDRQLGFFWSSPAHGTELTEQIAHIGAMRANTVCIPHARLTRDLLDRLRGHAMQLIVEQGLFISEEIRAQFPDSIPIAADGTPFDRDEWYVPACPNHPQVRQARINVITELLDQHGHAMAGLWLDFIRFPVRWERQTPELRHHCFCHHCLNLFLNQERAAYTRAETSHLARMILHERHAEWAAWKCTCIAHFVQAVKAQITARDLTLRLGMFALPWRRGDFDGAIRHVAGQDLALLARTIDCFSPMVYHKLCYQPPAWIASVIQDHAAWGGRPLLPIIQAVHSPDTMTRHELDQALTHALTASPEGALIFTLEPLLASAELAAVVRDHFTRQQA